MEAREKEINMLEEALAEEEEGYVAPGKVMCNALVVFISIWLSVRMLAWLSGANWRIAVYISL